jgi:NADH-quinone oxidoreductase subunit G
VPAAAQAVDMQTSFIGEAKRIAESLSSGQRAAVLLGNLAQHHPQAATLHRLGHELAQLIGANFGFLGEAANSVGGYVAGAVPLANTADMNARDMLAQPRRAYVLLNAEVELDCHNPRQALAAMHAAEFVVALSAFRHRALEYAHVLLPIAPFTETAGTFISTEGRVQSFVGVVPPLGETRPAWKVLRVLGSLLGIAGFEFTSAEEVRTQALAGVDLAARLSNLPGSTASPLISADGIQRIADVPIYFADALVRRAQSLQLTRDALPPSAWMGGALMDRLRVREGDTVRIAQQGGEASLPVKRDDRLPADCVRVAAAHPLTGALGDMFGSLTLERVAQPAMATA